jgi:glycyl-radical enzyme activating protein family
VGCGECLQACPNQAITFRDNHPVFHREQCQTCRACGQVCLQDAIRFVGEKVSSAHIMEIVRQDKAYYANSGGGVTVSGGEAFVQFDELVHLLSACRREGIHTTVETCGQVDPAKIRQAFPLIDLFLFDIKHLDRTLLKKETGAHLDTILENLHYIAASDPRKVIIRIPVIPGFNFSEKAIVPVFELALREKITHIHLLPYHTLGKDKYEQMGLSYPFVYDKILPKEELLPLQKIGEGMGLSVQIGG